MISVFGLMILNLLMIWGLERSLFWRQVIFWIFGGAVFYIVKNVGKENIFRYSKYVYAVIIFFLAVPLIVGQVVRGSMRWINIAGFTLQPSELAKPFLIGWISSYLGREGTGNFLEFLIDLILIFIPIILILLEPDLGSAGVILISLLVLVFIHKPKLKWWLPIAGVGLVVIYFGWAALLEPYQIARVTGFLNPNADPLGKGYNQIQAKIAIGAGGLLGRGFGAGRQTQLAFLPEKQTDFILAAISEELGFVGTFFCLGLYFYLFWWMIKKINTAKNPLDFNFRLGVFLLFFIQTIINLAMNLQLFPVVGLPLPLLSYGGSSLISTLVALGLL